MKLLVYKVILMGKNKGNTKPLYMRTKNVALRSFLAPLCICRKHKVETFLWLVYVVVAGQLGTIINVLSRWVFDDWDLLPALGPDSASGSFYTFSLVMIASLIGPIFIRFVNKKKPEYRPLVVVFVTILIFSLLFGALCYSFATQDVQNVGFKNLRNGDMCIDGKQLFFFLLAILFSWYSFGLSLSPEHEKEIKIDPDYQSEDDNARNELSSNAYSSTEECTSSNPLKDIKV